VDEDGIPIGERLFGAAGAPRVLIAEDELTRGPDGATRITLAEEGAA
jgi:hypothetical protein